MAAAGIPYYGPNRAYAAGEAIAKRPATKRPDQFRTCRSTAVSGRPSPIVQTAAALKQILAFAARPITPNESPSNFASPP